MQRRSVARGMFFAINFSLAVLFFANCIYCIIVPRNPFAFAGSLVTLAPVGGYALAELIGFVRNHRATEVSLGVANLACASFVAFGVISTVVQTVVRPKVESVATSELVLFAFIGAVIFVYLVLSGRYRLYAGSAS